MGFIVLYDANVLYSSVVRDLLIRIAQSGLVRAKWSDRILDETFDAIARNRPDIDPAKLERTRELMCAAVRDCLVVGYERLLPLAQLPDPKDEHVLAAAIKSHAQVIVTNNLRDFPAAVLEEWEIEAKTADAFVLDQLDLGPGMVRAAIQQIADSWQNPPGTAEDVVRALEREGLIQSAARLAW